MENSAKSVLKGRFELSLGQKVQGELTLDGENTLLSLDVSNSPDYKISNFPNRQRNFKSMKGVLDSGEKVSLLNCLEMLVKRRECSASLDPCSLDKFFCNVHFHPHYAVFGNEHVSYDKKEIIGVSFFVEDASILFYDPDIFGATPKWGNSPTKTLRTLVEQIIQSENIDHNIDVGENPQIFYYTGKTKIFEVKTTLGTISASHNPRWPLFIDSDGFEIENKVFINLRFYNAVPFGEARRRTFRVLNFFELILGRPQNLVSFLIFKEIEQSNPAALQVYGRFFPRYKRSENEQALGALINPIENPEKFSRVLDNWLKGDKDWKNARSRFLSSCFRKKLYDQDRLIAAANVFDLLPTKVVSEKIDFPEYCKEALEQCREAFKKLPKGGLREHALNILGLVDSVSKLRSRIRHRAKYITNKIGTKLPELSKVTDIAVNCRNYYVHANSSDIGYEEVIFFLTDTLEFVFVASDLIESGWDIEDWYEKGYTRDHPFGFYLLNYRENLEDLKNLLSSGEANS